MALNGLWNLIPNMMRKTPTQERHHNTTTMSRTKLAVFLLIAPGLAIVFSVFVLAVVNLIFNPTFWMTGDTESVNPTPLAITVLSVILLVTTIAGLASLLPSIIIGIILLIKSKR